LTGSGVGLTGGFVAGGVTCAGVTKMSGAGVGIETLGAWAITAGGAGVGLLGDTTAGAATMGGVATAVGVATAGDADTTGGAE
jgi:hypothetical protein